MTGLILKRIALGLTVFFGFFAGAFIIGETFADPGGWRAVGLVAVWLVPLLIAAGLAWWLPTVAEWVIGVAVTLTISTFVWAAVDSQAWRSFESGHGPVRAIAIFCLSIPIVVLGWHRPLFAGVTLAALVLSPFFLLIFSGGAGVAQVSVGMICAPLLIVALLLVMAGLDERGKDGQLTVERPGAEGRG